MPSLKVFIISITILNILSAILFFSVAFLFNLDLSVTFLFWVLFISLNLHYCTSSTKFLNYIKRFDKQKG